ncbi:MAG: hypothetical protein NZ602_10985 [Thermoguttaceae bacterium]|nr:hypothetical protein [Thermoguttaceae bacterium]
MTPLSIPMRWLHNEQSGTPLESHTKGQYLFGPGVGWRIVREDGCQQKAVFFQKPPPRCPSQPDAPYPEEVKKVCSGVPEREASVWSAKSPKAGWGCEASAQKSPGYDAGGVGQKTQAGHPAYVAPKESPSVGKRAICAEELLACIPTETLVVFGKGSYAEGRRSRVEMPLSRPSLEEPPADAEQVLETLVSVGEESGGRRGPGVDRRQPFEPASIEPPTASPPRLPLGFELLACSPSVQGRVTSADRAHLAPQLRRLLDAWPSVPKPTREAILAIIDAILPPK